MTGPARSNRSKRATYLPVTDADEDGIPDALKASLDGQYAPIDTAAGGYTVFDDVGQPLAPDLWVAVTEVREVTYNGSSWSVGSVIDLIGPDGPGYVMVGVARQAAARFNLQPYNQTVHHKVSATAATLTSIGSTTTTATGTQSAVVAAQNSPNADRLTSAGGAGGTAGVQGAVQLTCVGAPTDWATSGFSVSYTIRPNDASYNESGASTGARIAVGLSSGGSIATVLAVDALADNFIGFIRRSVNAGAIDANWQLGTRTTSTLTSTDTGVPFTAQNWYTLSFWMAPGGTVIGWRIVNHTAGTTSSGTWTPGSMVPAAATMLGQFVGVLSVDAVVRTVDVNGFALVT